MLDFAEKLLATSTNPKKTYEELKDVIDWSDTSIKKQNSISRAFKDKVDRIKEIIEYISLPKANIPAAVALDMKLENELSKLLKEKHNGKPAIYYALQDNLEELSEYEFEENMNQQLEERDRESGEIKAAEKSLEEQLVDKNILELGKKGYVLKKGWRKEIKKHKKSEIISMLNSCGFNLLARNKWIVPLFVSSIVFGAVASYFYNKENGATMVKRKNSNPLLIECPEFANLPVNESFSFTIKASDSDLKDTLEFKLSPLSENGKRLNIKTLNNSARNATPVYIPINISLFKLNQNPINGNLYELILKANSTEAKISKALFEIGNFSKEFPINSFNAEIREQLDFSYLAPKNYQANLTLEDVLNHTLTKTLLNISVPNDISGNISAENLVSKFPKIFEKVWSKDDPIIDLWINVTKGGQLINQIYKKVSANKQEFSYTANLSEETPGKYKLSVAARDEHNKVFEHKFVAYVPNEPAELLNVKFENNRSSINFSCLIKYPDTEILDVKAKIDEGPLYSVNPKDGNFDEKQEEVYDGREAKFSFYKSLEPWIEELDYQLANFWVNGSALAKTDPHALLNITGVSWKFDDNAWENISVSKGREVRFEYNISIKDDFEVGYRQANT